MRYPNGAKIPISFITPAGIELVYENNEKRILTLQRAVEMDVEFIREE